MVRSQLFNVQIEVNFEAHISTFNNGHLPSLKVVLTCNKCFFLVAVCTKNRPPFHLLLLFLSKWIKCLPAMPIFLGCLYWR